LADQVQGAGRDGECKDEKIITYHVKKMGLCFAQRSYVQLTVASPYQTEGGKTMEKPERHAEGVGGMMESNLKEGDARKAGCSPHQRSTTPPGRRRVWLLTGGGKQVGKVGENQLSKEGPLKGGGQGGWVTVENKRGTGGNHHWGNGHSLPDRLKTQKISHSIVKKKQKRGKNPC